MLNKDHHNLYGIIEAIEKIRAYISPFTSADEFFKSSIHFDAAMMNFIVIGEMVERLTDRFKEEHSHIDWYKIKGFRNLIAHDYFGIDAEEVWQIVNRHLFKLEEDIHQLLK